MSLFDSLRELPGWFPGGGGVQGPVGGSAVAADFASTSR